MNERLKAQQLVPGVAASPLGHFLSFRCCCGCNQLEALFDAVDANGRWFSLSRVTGLQEFFGQERSHSVVPPANGSRSESDFGGHFMVILETCFQ